MNRSPVRERLVPLWDRRRRTRRRGTSLTLPRRMITHPGRRDHGRALALNGGQDMRQRWQQATAKALRPTRARIPGYGGAGAHEPQVNVAARAGVFQNPAPPPAKAAPSSAAGYGGAGANEPRVNVVARTAVFRDPRKAATLTPEPKVAPRLGKGPGGWTMQTTPHRPADFERFPGPKNPSIAVESPRHQAVRKEVPVAPPPMKFAPDPRIKYIPAPPRVPEPLVDDGTFNYDFQLAVPQRVVYSATLDNPYRTPWHFTPIGPDGYLCMAWMLAYGAHAAYAKRTTLEI